MFSKSDIIFYSVVMFDEDFKVRSSNGLSGSNVEKTKKLVEMCDLLCLSLNHFGFKHRVFTNSVQFFKELSSYESLYDSIANLDLSVRIDKKIPFYLAMHKLELSKYINNEKEYAIVLDTDCIMVNDLPINYINAINSGMSSVYQITDQVVPAYGVEKILSDILPLDTNSNLGIWFGGEIFGGLSSHFEQLNLSYTQHLEKFNLSIPELNHCGDENILTNFIIEQMLSNKSFFDLGNSNVISRFWSCNTLHFPKHWRSVKDSAILHLPADKDFLSSFFVSNKQRFDPQCFLREYEYFLRKKGYQVDLSFFETPKKKWRHRFFSNLFFI